MNDTPGMDRRRLLQGAGAVSLLTALPNTAHAPGAMCTSCPDGAHATIDHLPRTLEELRALPDDQKILLAAATASGCDAVAYYTPDERGKFALSQHIDLYPTRQTTFAPDVEYRGDTFANEHAVRENATYHIPVLATDAKGKATDQIKGVIVLHGPDVSYNRLQTEQEAQAGNDMHEPVSARLAKLEMARDIVAEHQDLFGATGQVLKEREAHHKEIGERIAYFAKLKTDLFKTSPGETHQNPHLTNTGELMEIAVDKAINSQSTVISEEQRTLIRQLAELHDLGKTQMSTGIFKPWQVPEKDAGGTAIPGAAEENKARNEYFAAINHNHPLFTLVTMLMYPDEGTVAGAHHHGLFRYTDEELKQKLGDKWGDYKILTDNLSPEQVPTLSKMIRVSDVVESITGSTVDKPLALALQETAEKSGVVYNKDDKGNRTDVSSVKIPQFNPNSIEADVLCFMIDHGVFKAYGEKQTAEQNGWASKKTGQPKYDAEAVDKAGQQILAALGWPERKAEIEPKLLAAIANDPVIAQDKSAAAARGR
jgi:hypothetical protein